MRDITFFKGNQNNPKDLNSHYDYSSPLNYFGSILIQNEKRKWNQRNSR